MSIRKLILGAATLASLALPGMASAQRYDGGYGYRGVPAGYDRYYDNRRDYRDGYRDFRRDRWEERRRWREIERRREWERRHWRARHDDRYYRY